MGEVQGILAVVKPGEAVAGASKLVTSDKVCPETVAAAPRVAEIGVPVLANRRSLHCIGS
jgi:hypothetical protein